MSSPGIGVFVEYTSTAISLICLPINILFVIIVLREPKHPILGTPFFRLCIHLSMADILMALFSLILFKMPIFGWLPDSIFTESWAVVPIAGINYLVHAQAIGIIFIAINRFTAVYYPIQHKQVWWKPSTTTLLLIIQWTIPVLVVIPLFFTKFSFVTDHVTGSVSVTAKDPVVHKAYFMGVAFVDGVVINVIVSALYIAMFVRVRSHVVVRRPEQLVARLALSAFVIFVSYLALGVFSILSALAPPTETWSYNYRTLWFVVNDVLCASNAPVLLILNRPIRRIFLSRIGIENDLPKSPVTKESLVPLDTRL
ncbi:unnamed protein product, partial [Mesorhabditis spiculigera]